MALFRRGYDRGTLYFSKGRMQGPDDLKKLMFEQSDHGAIAGLQAAASTGRPKDPAVDWKTRSAETLARTGFPTDRTRS